MHRTATASLVQPSIGLALFLSAPGAAAGAPAIPWQDWTPAAFEQARRENRMIYVDVGTEWCTACKWMQEGTYTDAEVTRRLREHFVTIKVDAELQPDIGERYSLWGWPALIFMAPDGTQVRAIQGNRRPRNFIPVLDELIAAHAAGALEPDSQVRFPSAPTDAPLEALRTRVVAQLDGAYNDELGGWGRRQMLPLAAPVEHAFYRAHARGETLWRERALRALEGLMALSDPVWGGVYAGAVDGWRDGFPEKLARNQAAAMLGFAAAHHATGGARWLAAARAVQRYLDAFLRAPDGTYYASQDAELADHRTRTDLEPREYFRLGDAERRAIGVPPVDRAVHTDVNLQLAHAFVRLHEAAGDAADLAAAVRVVEALVATRRAAGGWFAQLAPGAADPEGRVRAVPSQVGEESPVYLRTQAHMGLALLALYQATGEARWREQAVALARAVRARLEDPVHGGFYASDAAPAGVAADAARYKPLIDNGVAARFLALLAYLDDSEDWRASALRAVKAVGNEEQIRYEGRMVGEYALALETLAADQVQFSVVTTAPGAPGPRALFEAAWRVYEPRKVLKYEAPGRYRDRGRPELYVCTTQICSQPMRDPAAVADGVRAFQIQLRRIETPEAP